MRWRLKRWRLFDYYVPSHSRVGDKLAEFRVTDEDEWVATQGIKELKSVFHAFVLLLIMNFVITLAVFMLETLKLSKTLKPSRDDFNV